MRLPPQQLIRFGYPIRRHAVAVCEAAKGLLTRKVYAEVPPRVEYTLTATGCSLRPILDSMVAWGTDYQKQNGGAPCDP